MKFKSKKPHYEYLRKKWLARHRNIQENFWTKHKASLKPLALGSLGGLLMLTSFYHPPIQTANLTESRDDVLKGYDQNVLLAEQLNKYLPHEVRSLDLNEETAIVRILSQYFGFSVRAEIDDIRLSKNYGLIGGEQHLYRYPGDNLYAHADSSTDFAKYGSAGIAPHLGAWGYFAFSKEEFTQKDKLKERYYLAIQTFIVPGYAENVALYRDFFKLRKMLVVNPKTGQTVVAVIGDAGPSEWTGKDLGGSPEVMDLLGLGEGPRKGEVLYFFIDDAKDEIPLGPIKVTSKASHPDPAFA